MAVFDGAFCKEQRILSLILIIFDFSYVLRMIFYCTIYRRDWSMLHTSKVEDQMQIIPGIFTDCLPILLMLVLHSRNY